MAFINLPGIIPSFADLGFSVPIGISQLGTPILDDITFPPGSFYNKDSILVPYLGMVMRSFKVIVTGQKTIIKTPVAGRDGTIKEYVNQQDYQISIDGKVTEFFNVFPVDQMQAWEQLWQSGESVPITSRYLNEIFNITDVVITRFSASPPVGSHNEVDLRFNLISDTPFDAKDFLVQ